MERKGHWHIRLGWGWGLIPSALFCFGQQDQLMIEFPLDAFFVSLTCCRDAFLHPGRFQWIARKMVGSVCLPPRGARDFYPFQRRMREKPVYRLASANFTHLLVLFSPFLLR